MSKSNLFLVISDYFFYCNNENDYQVSQG